MVADSLDESGQTKVGQKVQRYVSNVILEAYLAIVHDVRCAGYNAHSIGDLFEALLKSCYVRHGRSLDHPRQIVEALMAFVDSGESGVPMINPEWMGTAEQEAEWTVQQLLTHAGHFLFTTPRVEVVKKARQKEREMVAMNVVFPPSSTTTTTAHARALAFQESHLQRQSSALAAGT